MFRNRIDLAEKRMNDLKGDWERSEDAYNGKILDVKKSDFEQFITQVNLWYVDVRSSGPKLYGRNPYIFIDPSVPEADLSAETWERVVNSKLDVWKMKARIRSMGQGCKMKGRSYLKTFYKFDKEKISSEFIGEEPNDEVTIHFIPRDKLLIDPGAVDWEHRRWTAHKIRMPISQIRAKWNLKDDEKPCVIEEPDLSEKMPAEQKEDFQFGTVYEIEDLENKEISVIVDGVDRFVEKPTEHPHGFSMYDPLEWNEIPECLDTKDDLYFWYKLLVELCETKTQQLNHRRKLNSKYVFRGPNPPTPEQIAQIQTYKDATFVHLKPGESIEPWQHAQLGAAVYSSEPSCRQDIGIVSAMNEMRQGMTQVQKTAREAMAIYQESQDVMSERSSRVDDVIASVIKKAIILMQKNYDTTRVVDLTGMEEVEFLGLKEKFKSDAKGVEIQGTSKRPFVSFVGTQLSNKIKVRIKPGSARPPDESQRKEEIMALLQGMKSTPQISARVNWDELIKEIGKVFHLDAKRILIAPKNPSQENALLKQDIPVMPMLNEDHAGHLAEHERENNGTPAFKNHIEGHKLLESFLGRHQAPGGGAVPNLGAQLPGGVSPTNIPGMPMGTQGPVVAPPPQGTSPMATQPALVQSAA